MGTVITIDEFIKRKLDQDEFVDLATILAPSVKYGYRTPGEEEIIATLAHVYRVPRTVVIHWLVNLKIEVE